MITPWIVGAIATVTAADVTMTQAPFPEAYILLAQESSDPPGPADAETEDPAAPVQPQVSEEPEPEPEIVCTFKRHIADLACPNHLRVLNQCTDGVDRLGACQ